MGEWGRKWGESLNGGFEKSDAEEKAAPPFSAMSGNDLYLG